MRALFDRINPLCYISFLLYFCPLVLCANDNKLGQLSVAINSLFIDNGISDGFVFALEDYPSNIFFTSNTNDTIKRTSRLSQSVKVDSLSSSKDASKAIVKEPSSKNADIDRRSTTANKFTFTRNTPLINEQKITASDGKTFDMFGSSLHISGNQMIVGAHQDDDHGIESGSVYVYERTKSGHWGKEQKLTAADAEGGDRFGISVGINDEICVVGAYGDDDYGSTSGSVYVYEKNKLGKWTQKQKINASDAEARDKYGRSLSIEGDYLVVGAYGDNNTSGSVYVYKKDVSGHWGSEQKLTASDGEAGDSFGFSVIISDDQLAVGAHYNKENGKSLGAVYVYKKDASGTWGNEQKITALQDGKAGDKFGRSVSIKGNQLVIGAIQDDDNGSGSGSVYVYEKNIIGKWGFKQKILASDGSGNDKFGRSVSMSGDRLAVGADGDGDKGSLSGSVYIYKRDASGTWGDELKITAFDGSNGDRFGRALSIEGNQLLVGAFADSDNGIESGSVYINTLPSELYVFTPLYLRWWFIGLCAFIVIVLTWMIVKTRTQYLIKKQKVLEAKIQERTQEIERQSQQISKQAEELKALDKVKSTFFANISHELRTPLTLILGPLSNILENIENYDKETLRHQLQMMNRNGQNLLDLVEEILDLSKLESSEIELNRESTPLKTYFNHIFENFIPKLKLQDIDYSLNFDFANEEMQALIDRKKVEQVLRNFLSNAIKFTEKGGQIHTTISSDNNKIKIAVSDTGKGIHPKDLPHVFNRYYQSKLADQKRYGGTGIGLALAQEFASLMDGKTYVKSQLGEGSTFYFEIPLLIDENKQRHIIQSITEEKDYLVNTIGYDFNILVVEDNEDLRTFVHQILSDKYNTIYTASNGLEGLQILNDSTKQIDLVISDIMMPVMDGLNFAKQVKSNKVLSQIPILMLTALSTEKDKFNALTIGVDDYLCKPFSPTELLVRIQNLLFNHKERKAFIMEENQNSNIAPHEQEHKENEVGPNIALNQKDKEWLEHIEFLVRASLKEEILSVEDLAQTLNTSARQLTRQLKLMTGLTPGKLIKEIQLKSALDELEQGTFLSIKEVAFNNGFSNQGHFATLFKKRFGKSPSEYTPKKAYF